jgi:hypothetical protein
MKISVEYSLEVQARAEKLWDVLTDVEAWPGWQGTPFVKLSKPGRIIEDSAFVAVLGGMKWNLVVTKADRPYKIIWEGRRLGLRAVHEWEFKEEQEKTRATTRENITGWLLFLTYPIARKRLAEADEKWLNDLKVKAENF